MLRPPKDALTRGISCMSSAGRGHKLTKQELAIVSEVERAIIEENGGWVDGYCWLNAQRATLSDGKLLYHEGILLGPQLHSGPDGKFRHAWNSINGKVVDFSLRVDYGQQHRLANHYKAERTFTKKEVVDAFLARGMEWFWMP